MDELREELEKQHGLIQPVKDDEGGYFWKHKDPVCCIMYINRLKKSNFDVGEVKSDKAMRDEEIRDGLEYLNIRLELVKFFINQFEKNPELSIEIDGTLRGNLSILLNYLIPE